jgi:lipoprotein-releasing system permease protein
VFSKSKNNAINIISFIALSGIIVGTMALFVVLSVFSGLREYSVQFTNDFDPDLKINVIKGKSFTISEAQEKKLKAITGVENFSKIIEERVLFYFDGKEQVTYIKGVDSNYPKINKISSSLYNGQWLKPNTYQAVVGYGVANKLSLALFDFNHQLEVFVPKPGKGQINSQEDGFNKDYLIPIGIYAISDDIDNKFVFVDLPLAQSLMEFNSNRITGIEIKTKPDADLESITSKIVKVFDNKVAVKTRAELNATLHKMLNTENIAVYLIFTLVIIIALFNLIGALIMMILDKKDNLKTLLNLGTTITNIRKIFLFQGILISVLGGIVGLIIGIIAVILQQKFNLIMITDTLAYPVVFEIKNLLLVFVTITVLGFIASFIAGGRVSKNLLN